LSKASLEFAQISFASEVKDWIKGFFRRAEK